jgi:hypothetical protein
MQYLAFILNLPWTILGFFATLLSVPKKISFSKKPLAIIFHVRSFWWWQFLPGQKGMNPRAMVNGHCIQLGPNIEEADLAHEFIHVEQAIRQPFIHPILYELETRRHGYRNNKYEEEAYSKTGSRYSGK